MVEWTTRKREMRGNGIRYSEKLELKRNWSAGHVTMSNLAGITSDPAGQHTASCYSSHTHTSHTPKFPHSFKSSLYCSHFHLISLFFVHNFVIITKFKVQLYLSRSPCHDYKFTPSTASTKYSIHQVQHPPSRASTKSSIHSIVTVFTSLSRLWVHPWIKHELSIFNSTRLTTTS